MFLLSSFSLPVVVLVYLIYSAFPSLQTWDWMRQRLKNKKANQRDIFCSYSANPTTFPGVKLMPIYHGDDPAYQQEYYLMEVEMGFIGAFPGEDV